MFNDISEAIEKRNYQTAHKLLRELEEEESDNPWFQFYLARLQEVTGNLEVANNIYRELLKQANNRKIMFQARQGIDRITELEETQRQIETVQRQEALAQAEAQAGSEELAMLILEPIASELKQQAARKFGRIMGIDAYTARLQLPSRSWRLYRTGSIGTMRYYSETLKDAEIPCFCASITEIRQLTVYESKYFDSVIPTATIVHEPYKGEKDTLTFDWAEVEQRVEGMIPIFEECVEVDSKGKIQRKTKILDYVQFCDLHLKERKCIIRLCDHNYQFQEGIIFSEKQKASDTTLRDNWKNLIHYFKQQLPDIDVWSDFTTFAETAIDFQELLKLINPHINLLRREDSPWDPAFQLYSSLVFLKASKS